MHYGVGKQNLRKAIASLNPIYSDLFSLTALEITLMTSLKYFNAIKSFSLAKTQNCKPKMKFDHRIVSLFGQLTCLFEAFLLSTVSSRQLTLSVEFIHTESMQEKLSILKVK